jgi:hypothetical protein
MLQLGQDAEKDYTTAEEHARRGVALMEATFGKDNPRTATAYGTLAAILKCEPLGCCMPAAHSHHMSVLEHC